MKMFLHITVNVVPGKVDEFHDFWAEESLPLWEKYGARHLGSWTTLVGKGNEITRLFEFESFADYERWQQFLWQDEAGRKLRDKLFPYIEGTQYKIMMPAKYSPMK